MSNYKDTLNLPVTDFPMKADLASREPEMLKRWDTLQIYQRLMAQDRAQTFVLHDGPPYANGRPHMGTALNKTLKDIVVKSKWLSGFKAPYVPGWDCHGLPIELNVEKKIGKVGDKVSAKEFRQACRDYANSFIDLQREDFKRLGVFGDWQNPYLTLNFKYEADAVRALAIMTKQGHVLRGQKPVQWCPLCSSALAEAEVEYQEKKSSAIDVAFVAINSDEFFRAFNVSGKGRVILPIWTTTPWTLPANEAVALHPELFYALIKAKEDYFVVAKELLESFAQRIGLDDYLELATIEGQKLEGFLLKHPFLEKNVPVILGEHVDTETGTGAVHTSPAHGAEDYVVGKKYNLPLVNPVNSKSCYNDDVPFFAGLHVYKANEPVLALLAERGVLLHRCEITHSYPHCWRHKTPLIFRATTQWFVAMEQAGLRKQALNEIKHSKWIPAWGEQRIEKMVATRPDWCISRQRTWGIPITFLVHAQTAELHPDMPQLMQKIADKIEKDGVDAWYDMPISDLIGKEAEHYEKVTDILDVWFDSGVTHYCVLEQRPELYQPADLYLEGSDQHRGWFQSSLLTATAMYNHAPYKAVLTHGYVVDGKGYKMSKSLGNVILPADIVKTYGADVLRLWAASMDYTGEIAVSDEILKRMSEAYRRIRNTARFWLSNLGDFNPETDLVAPENMVELDRWAVMKAQQLQEKIIAAYENYQFQVIYQLIHNFCSVEMGSFYLDIIKDRQYTAKKDSKARRSSQTAMYYITQAFVRWIAPILSFTADEIWQFLPGAKGESVFFSSWFTDFPEFSDARALDEYWLWFSEVRNTVNKQLEALRAEGKIGSALDAKITLHAGKNAFQKLAKLKDELRFGLIVSAAEVVAKSIGDDEFSVQIDVCGDEKCVRCWQRRPEVGKNAEHPELCGRCVVNIAEQGEERAFA